MKIKLAIFFTVIIYLCMPTQGAVYHKNQTTENDSVLSGGSISVGSDHVLSGGSVSLGSGGVLSGDSTESDNIISIREHFIDDDYLYFSPINKKIDVSEIMDKAQVISDTYRYYYCDIIWDPADDIDTSTPGRVTLTGTVVPPDGFEFNKEAKVEKAIIIYDENNPTEYIKQVEYDFYTEFYTEVIGLGEDFSSHLEKDIIISTTAGDLFKADIRWPDTIAPNTQGEFEVTGKVVLPKGITAKNEADTFIRRKFYAMKDDKIYIEPYYVQGENIVYEWVYYVEDCQNIEVQYSFDNKNWLASEEDEFGHMDNDFFILMPFTLAPDKDYYFRLAYNGELTDTIFYSHNTATTTIIHGDHDGGDNFEQEIPPSSTYKPKRSSSKGRNKQQTVDENLRPSAKEQENQTEMSNSKTTVISGKRFSDLAELNDKVIFEKQGISAELDKSFITQNNIKSEDSVSVTIDKKGESSFSIDVNVNNASVKKIPDTVIRVTKVASNNTKDNTTKFVINETGEYSIDSKANDSGTAQNQAYNADTSDIIKPDADALLKNENHKKGATVSPLIIIFSIVIMAGFIYLLWMVLGKYAKQK